MATNWTPEQAERRYRAGRGRGVGLKYKSWLSAHDFPSTGRTTRMKGRIVVRTYVVFSDGERHCFLVLQWLPHVVDIREQFPLWPPQATQDAAARLGVRHPVAGGLFTVMTTDFLLTIRDGEDERLEAIAFKPAKQLDDRRTLEKLDIERVYWEELGVTFRIVTELDLPEALVRNLEWIDERYDLEPSTFAPERIPDLVRGLLQSRTEQPDLPLSQACAELDRGFDLVEGSSLSGFRHALARGHVEIPLDVAVDAQGAIGAVLARARPGKPHEGSAAG